MWTTIKLWTLWWRKVVYSSIFVLSFTKILTHPSSAASYSLYHQLRMCLWGGGLPAVRANWPYTAPLLLPSFLLILQPILQMQACEGTACTGGDECDNTSLLWTAVLQIFTIDHGRHAWCFRVDFCCRFACGKTSVFWLLSTPLKYLLNNKRNIVWQSAWPIGY